MKHRLLYAATAVAVLGAFTALPAHANHDASSRVRMHPNGSDSDPSVTSWATKCDFVGQRDIDPIGKHGATSPPYSDHHHIFFGSESHTQLNGFDDFLYNDYLRSLNMAGITPCKPPDKVGVNCDHDHPQNCYNTKDKSLYWFPALFLNQSDRTNDITTDPAYIFSYYRNEKVNPHDSTGGGLMTGLPANMSMVGGRHDATSGQGTQYVEWSCIQGDNVLDGERTHQGDTMPDTCQYDTTKTGTSYLRVIVEFPNCLKNGLVNTAPFYNYTANSTSPTPDMTYTIDDPTYNPPTQPWKKVCASGYHPIPQVGIGVRWKLGTPDGGPVWPGGCTRESAPHTNLWDCDTSHATLASDCHEAVKCPTALRGVTAHADFMSGWTQADMDTLMQQCFYRYDGDGSGDPDDPNNRNINCGVV